MATWEKRFCFFPLPMTDFAATKAMSFATHGGSLGNDLLTLTNELSQAIVWGDWEDIKEEMSHAFETPEIVIGTASVATGFVSVGYALWVVRGGFFLATLAAGVPSWRMIDPASLVMAYRNEGPKDAVEELMA